MSYTGRELPDVVKDNLLIETEDSYLTKTYKLNKNLSSKNNFNITTTENPEYLITSGMNLKYHDERTQVSPFLSMLHYYASDFEYTKVQSYKSTISPENNFEIIFTGTKFYEIRNSELVEYSPFVANRVYDHFNVFYETESTLYVKLSKLTDSSDLDQSQAENATSFTHNVSNQIHSSFFRIDKLTRVVEGLTVTPTTYPGLASKIYEDSDKVLFITQFGNLSPTLDSSVSPVTYGIVDLRVIIFDKSSRTLSKSSSSLTYELNLISYLSDPIITDNKILIYSRLPSDIRILEIDFSGEFSFTNYSLSIEDHTVSSYLLPKEFYLSNLAQAGLPSTQTIQRIKIPSTAFFNFIYSDDKEYLITSQIAINKKGADYCKATASDSSTIIFIYEINDWTNPIKTYKLPEGVYNFIRISNSEFLYSLDYKLYKLKFEGLVAKSSQVLDDIPYDLGSIVDGELFLTSGTVLKKLSLNADDSVITHNSGFSTEISSLEYKFISLEVSDFDGNLIENENFHLELLNTVNDQNESEFDLVSENGKLEFYISLNTTGQVGVRVTRDSSIELPQDISKVELSPFVSDNLRNWEILNITSSRDVKLADSISPNFILLVGAGGSRGSNVYRSINRNTYSMTGGAGGSGGVSLSKETLSDCQIILDSTSVKLLDNINSEIIVEAYNGSNGSTSPVSATPGQSGLGGISGKGQFTLRGLRVQNGHVESFAQGVYYPYTSRPHIWSHDKELGNYGSTASPGLARIYVNRNLEGEETPPYTPEFSNIIWQFDQNGYQLDNYTNNLSRYYGVLQVVSANITNRLRLRQFPIYEEGDFCIEFCFNLESKSTGDVDFISPVDNVLNDAFRIGVGASNTVWVTFRNGTVVAASLTSTDTIELNIDYHIALERYNGILSWYINGKLSGTRESPVSAPGSALYATGNFYASNAGTYKIWNLRASKQAIYKGEFEPTWWNHQYQNLENIEWYSKTDFLSVDASCLISRLTLTGKPVNFYNNVTKTLGLKLDEGLNLPGGSSFLFTQAANAFLTQSYTIDFWLSAVGTTSTPVWFLITSPYTNSNRVLVGNESNQLTVWNNQDTPRVKGGSLPAVSGTLNHVALTYSAGVWRYWHNGVNTITLNYTPSVNANLVFGLAKRDVGTTANVSRYRFRPGLKFKSTFNPMDTYSDSGFYINNPKPGVSGIYLISAPDGSKFEAYCDMESDGGFWILTHHWIGSIPTISYKNSITKGEILLTYSTDSNYKVIPEGYLNTSDYMLLKHTNPTWIATYGNWQKLETLRTSDTYTGIFPIRTRVNTSALYDRSLAWSTTPSINSTLSFWTTDNNAGWCGGAGVVGPTKICPVLGPSISAHATNSNVMQLYLKASNNLGAGCISEKVTLNASGATVVGFYVNEYLGPILLNDGKGTTLEYNLNATQFIRITSLVFHPRYDLGQFFVLMHYTTHTGQIKGPRVDTSFKILINGNLITLSGTATGNGTQRRHGEITEAAYLNYIDPATPIYFELVEA